ncbi:imidazole glycerol phosphate synthase subunit HisF [Staphylococcus carnosus]|uniref:Imidazole glycerol phosphate synthase subunit HisF n=1 Tax=Staphylococcus carnosus (strain TM300) TaxID=396513 RepID=HIS6_STACT|nr:imidazole glycerol phosphate synthase subunit HisF [Staphylococcus carnosus]B9DIP1.1 RecName: Full=Imidazole glycerol phosphate synthase subunit HisF; AltName: Full=IGP synthase cyclase subunit; AltName: Full=IGP synthase subunit HisF; AltName: Full=ImGP synthase subunit HisF; Short=IGPS subunit HisF [Staphylococcus carnosus subsp. carnosus TM300]KOR14004.1 imidazole glycerol phosphate synthase [Staphylococcus carnosus]QPT03713.1 imidazole glycerol phosphate synthase subunit HisF [Staphylococ
MIKKRIIPCLDVKDGRVVKGVQFKGLRDIGDPVALAAYYNAELADELVFLDISRTENGHQMMLDIIEETASKLFIPLTIGGGISSTDDISTLLKHGADKVSLNSSALRNPSLVKEASEKFGSQCICIAVDAKWEDERNDWFCYTHGGKQPTDIRVLDWVRQVEYLGAGELLVTSMDYDGVKQGFDHQLLNQINTVVSIPVIASGGGGNAQHFVDLFQQTNVSAGLAASIFHDKETTIGAVKTYLKDKGVDVRWH